MLDENGDKQSQNTHLEVNIFARQKSIDCRNLNKWNLH